MLEVSTSVPSLCVQSVQQYGGNNNNSIQQIKNSLRKTDVSHLVLHTFCEEWCFPHFSSWEKQLWEVSVQSIGLVNGEAGLSQLDMPVCPWYACLSFPTIILGSGVDKIRDCVLIWLASNLVVIKSSFFGFGLLPCWQGRCLQAASTPWAWQSPFAFKVTKSSLFCEYVSCAMKSDFSVHCSWRSVSLLMAESPLKAWG